MTRQVIGGFIGAHVSIKIKVEIVHLVLIEVIVFTGFALVCFLKTYDSPKNKSPIANMLQGLMFIENTGLEPVIS